MIVIINTHLTTLDGSVGAINGNLASINASAASGLLSNTPITFGSFTETDLTSLISPVYGTGLSIPFNSASIPLSQLVVGSSFRVTVFAGLLVNYTGTPIQLAFFLSNTSNSSGPNTVITYPTEENIILYPVTTAVKFVFDLILVGPVVNFGGSIWSCKDSPTGGKYYEYVNMRINDTHPLTIHLIAKWVSPGGNTPITNDLTIYNYIIERTSNYF